MPAVTVTIRKTEENGPWMYTYEQDGTLETVIHSLASANAALDSAKARIIAEQFAAQIKTVRLNVET